MDFVNEFKKRVAIIDNSWYKPKVRYFQRSIKSPCFKYDLVIKDLEGKVIKEIGWGLSLKDCIALSKKCDKSRLIKESEGQYTLQYVKIERGIYDRV